MKVSKFFFPSMKKNFPSRGLGKTRKYHVARPEGVEISKTHKCKLIWLDRKLNSAQSGASENIFPIARVLENEKNCEILAKNGPKRVSR